MSSPSPTAVPPPLNARARRILYAVVTEYVATGEPVGSRKLARRYGLSLSPATIRNVLADLEEAGLLLQPHTSAGRVPTAAGYRLFIDALVQMRELGAAEQRRVRERLAQMDPVRDDVVAEVGRLLASFTGAAAVVAAPPPERSVLAGLHFLPLDAGRVLAVLVTRGGAIENRVVLLDQAPERDQLQRLNNFLAELAPGRTLAELREALAERLAGSRARAERLRAVAAALVEAAAEGASRPRMAIEGQELLFERPEFSDVEKLRSYLRTLEEHERLLDLLERTLQSSGVQVLIGEEAQLGELDDVSIVGAPFGAPHGGSGMLGVIGPSRMDYARVVPLVDFAARCMSELLAGGSLGGSEPPEGS